MSKKERVAAAIAHERPDRIPIHDSFWEDIVITRVIDMRTKSNFTFLMIMSFLLNISLLSYCGKKTPTKITEQYGSIHGHVYSNDEPSQPVAGVDIYLDTLHCRSDADGAYQFDDVIPGQYTMRAQYPGFADYEQGVSVANEPVTHDIYLTPEATVQYFLTGTVMDEVTLDPLPGAVIALDGVADTTDAAGFYRFTDLELKTYAITAQKERYVTFSGKVTIDSAQTTFDISMQYNSVLSDDISENMTLHARYSPYTVNPGKDYLLVSGSSELNIEPGVRVEFHEGKGIDVRGRLTCAGTGDAPVHLTSQRGDSGIVWNGLKVTSDQGDMSLSFTKIEHATRAIDLQWAGNITMESCIIQNSWSGINAIWHNDLSGFRIDTRIKNSIIRNCREWGGVFLTVKEKGTITFENCLIDRCSQNLIRLEADVELLMKSITLSNSDEDRLSGITVNEVVVNHADAVYNCTRSEILDNHSPADGAGIVIRPDIYFPVPGRVLISHNNFVGNESYAIRNYLPQSRVSFDNNYVCGNNGKPEYEVDLTTDGSGGQTFQTPVTNPGNVRVSDAGAKDLPGF
ncbi:MAG: carboxypeptidase regulatory-like domain-containing protein [candidate division KSB1 bacterium]|jgi:hypothetical protein|nr:carboxypeptidase regulatory-like domain-containing protein [candidate division KSB1 bacterium]